MRDREICVIKPRENNSHYRRYFSLRNELSMTSPSCVSDIIDWVTPSQSDDDDCDEDFLRHQLVEQWFRERFFLPRPYRSTSLYDADSLIQNDIIDDNSSSAARSMALFSDSMVYREIRSTIVPVFDDEDSTNLRPRCSNDTRDVFFGDRQSSSDEPSEKSRDSRKSIPSGITVVLDGAPFLPLDRSVESEDVIMGSSSSKSVEGCDHKHRKDDNGDTRQGEIPSLGFIQRTFSFDEQLPMVHTRGSRYEGNSSFRSLTKTPIQEDDCYMDEQPSFTIPVTYSKDCCRTKFIYPLSIP